MRRLHLDRPHTGALADRIGQALSWLDEFDTPPRRRWLTGASALLGLLVFVLGVGNRFTRGPWFLYIPEVDLIPPLSRAAWQRAFEVHQQSPLYALCGGYQVGGMESLTVYQFLYFWEWLREGALIGLLAALLLLLAVQARRAASSRLLADTRPLLALLGFAAGYLIVRWLADHAGLFATLNFGQHRHAVDVTFASLGLAMLLAHLFANGEGRAPLPLPVLHGVRAGVRGGNGFVRGGRSLERRSRRLRWLPAAAVALVIAAGALLEAMDGAVLWTAFPGYGSGLLPGADRLFAFTPTYRNLTENGYFIQAVHRVVSYGLWIFAALALLTAWRRGLRLRQPALLLGLITLDGALGALTLAPGQPVALSLAHQVCGVLVLAAAMAAGRTKNG